MEDAMKRLVRDFTLGVACVATFILLGGTPALATGQPGAPANTCGASNPVTPGAAASAPGSPFNLTGQAGNVYAGNPGTASLASLPHTTNAVSQYDTACVRLSH
jgi:hypothetical protein